MKNQQSISEVEEGIIESFTFLESWEDRYEYLIELGRKLPPLEDQYKVENLKIHGCQSTVWLFASCNDGRVYFKADSDAVIVKGLISMLISVLSGQQPEDILDAKLNFIQAIGLHEHLANTRSNGLRAMVAQMKAYAMAFQVINN